MALRHIDILKMIYFIVKIYGLKLEMEYRERRRTVERYLKLRQFLY